MKKKILPVCFCVSTNTRVGNLVAGTEDADGIASTWIQLARQGMQRFYDLAAADPDCQTEASIIIFDDSAREVRVEELIQHNTQVPALNSGPPASVLDEGVEASLRILRRHTEKCRRSGAECYQPMLVVFYAGNGKCNSDHHFNTVAEECRRLQEAGELHVELVCIRPDAQALLAGLSAHAQVRCVDQGVQLPEVIAQAWEHKQEMTAAPAAKADADYFMSVWEI